MKFSFMSFSCPELSLDETLAIARKYGYDGIEPRISENHKHGIEMNSSESFREKSKQKAQSSGISFCCVATSCSYANPENNKEMASDTHRAIDLAGDIGAPRIRVFGGGIPEGLSRESALSLLVESMQAVANHAEERGVIVCMETHDDWCNPEHMAEVMKQVNHPAIAVNWDIMHPVVRAKFTIDKAFQVLKPWVKHVHFHDGLIKEDGNVVLVPIGDGNVDHQRAVELLQASGYDSFMSGEWIGWEPYETHLPREILTMKRYLKESLSTAP